MLFAVWNSNENKYRWVKVQNLGANLGYMPEQPKVIDKI